MLLWTAISWACCGGPARSIPTRQQHPPNHPFNQHCTVPACLSPLRHPTQTPPPLPHSLAHTLTHSLSRLLAPRPRCAHPPRRALPSSPTSSHQSARLVHLYESRLSHPLSLLPAPIHHSAIFPHFTYESSSERTSQLAALLVSALWTLHSQPTDRVDCASSVDGFLPPFFPRLML